MPQQWLANTTAPGVAPDDRRRLDFVIYGAAARGEPLCCDATLVAAIRRDGSPVAGAPERDGVVLATARRRKLARYPELARGGPHRLCVLAAEIGGRWNDDSQRLVQRLVASRAHRAPATLRGAAAQGWARRWWGSLAVAVQRAACSAALGVWTMPSLPNAEGISPSQRSPTLQLTRRQAGCRCGDGSAHGFGAPRISAARVKHLSGVTRGGDRIHRCRRKKVREKKICNFRICLQSPCLQLFQPI